MQIAAVHGPDGKIFGTRRDNHFRPLLAAAQRFAICGR
jgi:hypothetical protein